ncbi:MAG: hypothetical protein ACOVKL_04920 [Polynucleobacter sp.]
MAAATTGNMSAQNADAVAITGGAISDTSITVADNVFTLQDNLDPTKQAQFQLSGLLTAQTTVYTLPVGFSAASLLLDAPSTQTINGIKTFSSATQNVGSSVNASTQQFAYGATSSGNTKTVNVGTGGLSGSTTNITVGAVAGTSTTTMNGQTDIGGTTTSVNFARVVGAATGANPTISAQGSDATIALNITSKSFGVVNINTGTGTVAKFVDRGVTTVDSPYIFRAGLAGVQAGAFTLADAGIMQVPGATGFQFRTNAGASTAPAGQNQLTITHTASAVNYLQLTGAATTAAPTISAQGSDANINLAFLTKGTGGHTFTTGGGQQFVVANIASSVNYLQAQGAPTGSSVGISVQGTDSNISIGYFGKGTGFHFFYTNGIAQASISPTASAVNRVNLTGAATGGAVSVSASGSDSNASLALFGQNAGVVALAGSTITNAAAVFVPIASVANYFQVKASVTTGAPELAVIGSDANINLKLTPKGTGVLQFGTYTAGALSPTGYITITDAAGTSRRLLVG